MRFRRLRNNQNIRALVRETRLHKDDFIQPFFVIEGKNKREKIPSMPGIDRLSTDLLLKEIENFIRLGGRAGLFFGVPRVKDLTGEQAVLSDGLIPKTVAAIKKRFPEFLVVTDVCLCAYLKHGHCGILKGKKIDNDATIPLLGEMSVACAQAGADVIAPSDMMDFRVARIRQDLDKQDFQDVLIMSYAVKYASSFYGPFRDAAHSAPEFGDRKSYQMDCANAQEALKEARQDIQEGADIIMVKPALSYLDIISRLKSELTSPIAAYSVSGEYAMIKAAAAKNWINEKDMVLETATSIKRAGANIIISYHAKDILQWL